MAAGGVDSRDHCPVGFGPPAASDNCVARYFKQPAQKVRERPAGWLLQRHDRHVEVIHAEMIPVTFHGRVASLEIHEIVVFELYSIALTRRVVEQPAEKSERLILRQNLRAKRL